MEPKVAARLRRRDAFPTLYFPARLAGRNDSRTMDDTFQADGHPRTDPRVLGTKTDEAQPTVGQIATDHLQALQMLLVGVELDAVERVVQRLRAVRDSGSTVYLAGNGGSAATASHWANDLGRSLPRPVRQASLRHTPQSSARTSS